MQQNIQDIAICNESRIAHFNANYSHCGEAEYAAVALAKHGDGRQATGDGRRATGDGRRATGDERRATGDGVRALDGRATKKMVSPFAIVLSVVRLSIPLFDIPE